MVVHEGAEAGEVRVDAQARQGEVHARVADLEEGPAQYSTELATNMHNKIVVEIAPITRILHILQK